MVSAGMAVALSTLYRGASSPTGRVCGVPYTAAVEENTKRRTPACWAASSKQSEPDTLFAKYLAGLLMDTPAAL